MVVNEVHVGLNPLGAISALKLGFCWNRFRDAKPLVASPASVKGNLPLVTCAQGASAGALTGNLAHHLWARMVPKFIWKKKNKGLLLTWLCGRKQHLHFTWDEKTSSFESLSNKLWLLPLPRSPRAHSQLRQTKSSWYFQATIFYVWLFSKRDDLQFLLLTDSSVQQRDSWILINSLMQVLQNNRPIVWSVLVKKAKVNFWMNQIQYIQAKLFIEMSKKWCKEMWSNKPKWTLTLFVTVRWTLVGLSQNAYWYTDITDIRKRLQKLPSSH